MKQMVLSVGFGVFLLFQVGCVSTRGLESEAKAQFAGIQPREQRIPTEFIVQTEYSCGPSSLTMLLKRLNPKIEYAAVSNMSVTPGAQGSFQNDIVASARRLGFAAYPIDNFAETLSWLSQGEPVLVFQNLGFKFTPVWHYALAVGYKADEQVLLLNTGDKEAEPVKLDVYLKAWERGEQWAYAFVTPDQIPGFATADEALENAEVFSHLGKRIPAEQIYTALQTRWPERFEADAGLAIEHAAQGDLDRAIEFTKTAIDKKPDHAGLYFNLSHLLRQIGDLPAAEKAKQMSLLKVQPEDREELIQRYDSF